MLKVLGTAAIVLIGATNIAAADMSVSFEWGQTKKCFDKNSPPMKISGVPDGTTKLKIWMTDRNEPTYPHGGATIPYGGSASLPYGAFNYKGPCPPSPHVYQFTVKALDAKGKTLATATARQRFP